MLGILLIGSAYAQDRRISGRVTAAADGAPISGVSVLAVGANSATQTDDLGTFSINVPQAVTTLEFRSLGYVSQKVTLGSQTNLEVILETDATAIDEVVVIAYGTAKRSSFTGSAATVNSEIIENRPITNISKVLDGAVPGVQSTLGSGQPGSSAGIRVRGFGSINASADPLYVVDGVPFNGDLNAINPNDVETVTVLKDASASSLYGSRAANGVVMITTKSGRNLNGNINVNFRANVGVSSRALKRYDVLNTKEYVETVFQAYKNHEIFVNGTSEDQAGVNAINRMVGTVDPIFGVNEQYNPYNMPVAELIDPITGQVNSAATLKWDDNWLDEVTANNPVRQEYQFDITGGTEKLNAMASFNALKENGLLKTTAFDRYTGRVAANLQATDWFSTSLSTNFSKANSNLLGSSGSSTSNVWYSAEQMAPIYPIWERDANGAILNSPTGEPLFDYGLNRASGAQQNFNSVAVLYEDKYYDNRDNASARATVEFNTRDEKYGAWSGFNFAMNLGADYINRAYTFYYNPYFGNASGSGRLNKTWGKTFSYTFNQILSWNRDFEGHTFDIMAGHENYTYKFNHLEAEKTGFPFGGIYELAPGSSISDATSYENNETLESYFSRVNYDFLDRYFLSASFRTDGSSRFHRDYRWGNFWSLGGAWRVSEESFMSDAAWLDNLTLKASYGTQGNNNLPSDLGGYFAWQAFYDLTWNNANNNGGAVTSVENQRVSWEKIASFNTGFEATLLDGRLTAGFDWYNRKTTDMLLNRPLALSLGFDGFNDNIGDMKNWGFDATVGYDVVKNADLTWNITAMASKINNKVLRLTDDQNEIIGGSTIIRVGEEVNSFYMARSAGVDPATGDQLYWVYDNPEDEGNYSSHYISNDRAKAAASRVMLGSRIPKLYGSLSSSVSYKSFDLAVMTTYSIGGKVYDYVGYNYYQPLYIGNNFSKDVLRAWQQPGDITDIPRIQKEITHTLNDRALVDASYFAIKNIAVGYTFEFKRLGIESVRIFAQGDNIAIFSARQGLNPQYNFSGSTDFVYTPTRTISAGLNLKF